MAERWIRDHFGGEVRPRPDFVQGLEGELSAAWPAEVDVWAVTRPEPDLPAVGAISPSGASLGDGGRRRSVWLVAATLVVVAGAGVAYVATRNADSGSALVPGTALPNVTAVVPGGTTSPVVSDVPGGTEPTATSGESTMTTVHATFDPACRDEVTGATPPSIDESAADTLSDLPSSPTLTVRLPKFVSARDGLETPMVTAIRIRGGVLLNIHDNGETQEGGTMLAAVGADGAVWWVRCLPPTAVTSADSAEVSDHVVMKTFCTDCTDTWHVLSLADGSTGAATVPPPDPTRPVMEYPAVDYSASADGTAQDVIGRDASRNELWRDDSLDVPAGEGFRTGTIDGLGLAIGCNERGVDDNCLDAHLRAYDPYDGTVQWDTEGVADVVMIADGRAIVRVGDGYRMLSLSDGSFIPGQQWPEDAFSWECCGGSDYHWNELHGGIVVHTDSGVVAVWYPAALGLSSHDISLP